MGRHPAYQVDPERGRKMRGVCFLGPESNELAAGMSRLSAGGDVHVLAKTRDGLNAKDAAHLEILSKKHRWSATKLPEKGKYQKNLLTHLPPWTLDACVLVVSVEEGVTDVVSQHYQIAKKHAKVQSVIPFIHCPERGDEFIELCQLVKMELSEVLEESDLERTIFGCVSKEESVSDVFQALDECQMRESEDHLPLLWPLEQIGDIPKRGTFVAGRIRG